MKDTRLLVFFIREANIQIYLISIWEAAKNVFFYSGPATKRGGGGGGVTALPIRKKIIFFEAQKKFPQKNVVNFLTM